MSQRLEPKDWMTFLGKKIATTYSVNFPAEAVKLAWADISDSHPLSLVEAEKRMLMQFVPGRPVPLIRIIEQVKLASRDLRMAEERDRVSEWNRQKEKHPGIYDGKIGKPGSFLGEILTPVGSEQGNLCAQYIKSLGQEGYSDERALEFYQMMAEKFGGHYLDDLETLVKRMKR